MTLFTVFVALKDENDQFVSKCCAMTQRAVTFCRVEYFSFRTSAQIFDRKIFFRAHLHDFMVWN